jgi:hypothetical protein
VYSRRRQEATKIGSDFRGWVIISLRGIVKSARYQIPARADLAARPASHAVPPITAKNTAAQASQADSLFVMIATKIVNAAIPHREAIARPHQ